MGEGRDGIAAHGFGADTEGEINFFQGDGVGSLADGFHAGATDPLDEMRGAVRGDAGVKADVAREHEGVEAGLRDAASDYRVNVGGRNFGALENGAGGFDAEVNGRDQAEDAIVIGEGSADAVEEPDVVVVDEKTACPVVDMNYFSLSLKMRGGLRRVKFFDDGPDRRSRTAR